MVARFFKGVTPYVRKARQSEIERYTKEYEGGVMEWDTAQMVGAAPTSHNHNASAINAGTFPIARGGTGVSAMAGTDYSTNRPRGIILQASEPSTVANGCLVGVYE